jgi:hypothetical protein
MPTPPETCSEHEDFTQRMTLVGKSPILPLEALLFGSDPARAEEGLRRLGAPADPETVNQLLDRCVWRKPSDDGFGNLFRWVDERSAEVIRGRDLAVWLRLLLLASPGSTALQRLQHQVTSVHLTLLDAGENVDLSGLRLLTNLERVSIELAPALLGMALAALPRLKVLRLNRCGTIPPFAVTSLRELDMTSVDSTFDLATLNGAAALEKLRVFATRMQGAVPLLPALRTLDVSSVYGAWTEFASAAALPALAELTLCLPPGVADLQALRTAHRFRTLRLTSLDDHFSLAGLEGCQQLETLNYSGGALSSLAPLRDLRLRELLVQSCHVPSLDDLADQAKLESLQINASPFLREVKGLARCEALRSLTLLSAPELSSLEGLQACAQLQELWVSNAAIDDLLPLGALRQLKQLNLSDCARIRSLEPLVELPALECITVRGVKLSLRKVPVRLRPLLDR